ncbi:ABC1 kinase family protein [Halarsenatibacter silvermanii]|uniref:2-octaprenylphenol hydroxylase n=1 Tax=Halarsenatibacter silvermanii TaxID=321763 RepID=A0A1G9JS31_9FIRM|nr:AarF/ABC1/UbiB kinase family protein [Halarsenatibacter silvermanii]SDL40076.1 2-octaprenylphenol hydroxylase [Halarsenatibacter silvermanii]
MDFNVKKKYEHFQRYREISRIFIKNGLGFLLDYFDLWSFAPIKKRLGEERDDIDKSSLPKRLRVVLEELGPTYVKLGQLLSTRPDILPPEYIQEFRRLQDDVPPVDYEEIKPLLEEELGDRCDEIFSRVEREAQAGASIAQIHRAVLHSGESVVMKIQRPGIREKIRTDLEIIENLAEMAAERKVLPDFIDVEGIVEEFKESLFKELDFMRELYNIKRFRDNFSHEDQVTSPEVYEEYSSRRVLVMEEIEGRKLSEFEPDDRKSVNASELARVGAESLLKQVMIDGFFHADPHPGNLIVVNDDTLAYIDFGLMGQISSSDRDRFALLFAALLRRNVEVITDIILEIGEVPENLKKRKLKIDIEDFIYSYYNRRLEDINFKVLFQELQHIVFRHHIKLPQEFFLLFRALSVSEGVGSTLDPEFNIVTFGEKFIKKILKDRLSPDNLLKKFGIGVWRFYRNLKGMPADLSTVLEKLKMGELSIIFKHENLEELEKKLDLASNRLSISMIISSLIIGSSLIIQAGIPPFIYNIPIFGLAGFSAAGILGLWLVISIFRSGRF